MMKKRLSILLIVMVVLMGCGSNGYPGTSRGVINAFFGEFRDGNLEGSLRFCDENGYAYDKISKITEATLTEEFALSISDDPDIQDYFRKNKDVQRLFHSYYTAMFKNFQIVDYREEEDEATYQVSVNRLSEEYADVMYTVYTADIYDEFYKKHQQEIDTMTEESGYDAVLRYYFENVGKQIVDSYLKRLNAATYENKSYIVEMKKIDRKWKIEDYN